MSPFSMDDLVDKNILSEADETQKLIKESLSALITHLKPDTTYAPSDCYRLINSLTQNVDKLDSILKLGNDHQRVQTEIDLLNEEIKDYKTKIKALLEGLMEKYLKLQEFLFTAKKHRQTLAKEPIDADLVLKVAKNVGGTTSAPLGWNGEPLGLYRPAVPQEDQIRASKLFQTAYLENASGNELNEMGLAESMLKGDMDSSLKAAHNVFNRPVKQGQAEDLSTLFDL